MSVRRCGTCTQYNYIFLAHYKMNNLRQQISVFVLLSKNKNKMKDRIMNESYFFYIMLANYFSPFMCHTLHAHTNALANF